MNRLTNYNTETGICLCSIDSSCHDSIHFVPTDFDTMLGDELIAKLFSYAAAGIVKGCFKIDELRLSTLECFYENTECFQNLIDAVNITYLYFTGLVPQFTPRPLVNDSTATIFQPETHVSDIIDAMMINTWNFSFSFDEYYQTCQPNYCTYLQISQETSPINIIISLVSLIGGLSVALRILTQLSVKLLFRILRPATDRSNESRQNETTYFQISLMSFLLVYPSSRVDFLSNFKSDEKNQTCFVHKISSVEYFSQPSLS